MLSINIVIGIIFIHWVADFLCQTDWMATNKSKDNSALLSHTSVYSLLWLIPAIFFIGKLGAVFVGITFIAHTITDYFTSRINSKLWKEQKVHWFFVSVGFDQVLHYTQLLLTCYFLIKL